MRRAKIVCTLGPATDSYDQIKALVEAGMDVARLNLSHGTHAEHEERYHHVRKASDETGRSVGILADLQGPKIRLGHFTEGPALLERGDTFTITTEDEAEGNQQGCGTTHPGLATDVTPGERILVDDGKVCLQVTDIDGPHIHTTVIEGGIVSDHKGLNLPGAAVSVPALSDKDETDLRWALRTGCDVIALSFVRSGRDIQDVHRIMDEEGRRLPVIAKVEKPQAVEAIDDIVAAFDGIMVARGDLGVEMPLEHVPIVQKRAIKLAKRNAKPVIVATQMLDSMIDNSRPTRAEASDVANAVIDGTDAVMLSGETSVGKYPIETVRTMAKIVEAAEEDILAKGLPPLTERNKPRTQGGAVARAAAEMGDFLGAKFLVAFTQSGDTAKRLSRYRSPIPLLAFTPDPATRSQLTLTWGVETFLGPHVDSTDAMVDQVDELLLKYGRCQKGDVVVITAGSPPGSRARRTWCGCITSGRTTAPSRGLRLVLGAYVCVHEGHGGFAGDGDVERVAAPGQGGPFDAHLVECVGEQLPDVVRLVGEEVPRVFVALAFAAHEASRPVRDAAPVGVDEAADEFPGVGVDDVLLPGFEGNEALVLPAGAVLGKQACQVLVVSLDGLTTDALYAMHVVRGEDGSHRGFGLVRHAWPRVGTRDHQAGHAVVHIVADVSVSEVLT